ncbi:MAG: thioredoxin domain-containing protein [Nitrospirae bacterium]|nr:thioredoxin domain-containing protein [Nitrospirota bacterium]
MSFRKLFVVLSLFLLSIPAYADQSAGIEGVYEKLTEHKFSFDGKQVEVMEFLSFYCSHCYHFEKSIPVIKGNFPGKIRWKTIPVYWGEGSPKPGEAYFLAEEAGKGEEMKKALFEAVFVNKRDIGNIEVLEDIGMKVGLGFDFSHRLRTGEKAKNVGEAIIMSKTYNIEETPTLVIAGNLKTSPSMFQGNADFLRENAIIVLKSILKK